MNCKKKSLNCTLNTTPLQSMNIPEGGLAIKDSLVLNIHTLPVVICLLIFTTTRIRGVLENV